MRKLDPQPGDWFMDKDGDLAIVLERFRDPEDDHRDKVKALFFEPYNDWGPYIENNDEPEFRHIRISVSYLCSRVTKVQAIRRPGVYSLECPGCGSGFIYYGDDEYLCKECR